MLPFLASVPKLAVMVAALNSAGVAIPGQSFEIFCTQPDGVQTTMFGMGDMPMASVPITATDCRMPPGYLARLW